MPETTFAGPDPMTFLALDALGLTTVGQFLASTRGIGECRMPIGFEDPLLQGLRCLGAGSWDGVPEPGPSPVGVETHAAAGTHAALRLHLLLRVRRQDASRMAQPRERMTRSAVEWGYVSLLWSACRSSGSRGAWGTPGTPPTARS